MAKVPTIYDIGNFSLDWNNAENIANPGFGKATKDGVLHLHCLDNTSPEGLSASIIVAPELQTDSTDDSIDLFVKDPLSKFISVGGYEAENKGSFHLIIPVHKDECFYFYEKYVETTFKRQFIPFLYQGVEPTPGCVSYVIETGHNLDNTAFYRKYSDGYIEQYGKILLDQSGTAAVTVTLPTQFTSSNYIVTLGMTGRNNGGATPMQECNVNDLTENTFELRYYLTGVASGSSHYIFYRACGY